MPLPFEAARKGRVPVCTGSMRTLAFRMRMRLATFNIENFDRTTSKPDIFRARVAALAPLLAQLEADVLCLQEVNAQKPDAGSPRSFAALDLLLADTIYSTFHRVYSVRPETGEPADVHNLAILSRWPVIAHRQVHHDFVPVEEWPALSSRGQRPPLRLLWDRPLLYAAVAPPQGAPLHIVNLHLRAPRAAFISGAKQGGRWRSSAEWAEGYYLAGRKRQGQALEARLFVETLFDADPAASIAVCGDLNAEAFETPTRILEALPDDVESAEFSARRLEPLERRVEPARRHTVIHDRRPVLLDHILASPALAGRCVEVDIANAALVDEAHAPADVAGSLHAPVVAVFER